jgi:hypothetical protein
MILDTWALARVDITKTMNFMDTVCQFDAQVCRFAISLLSQPDV